MDLIQIPLVHFISTYIIRLTVTSGTDVFTEESETCEFGLKAGTGSLAKEAGSGDGEQQQTQAEENIGL